MTTTLVTSRDAETVEAVVTQATTALQQHIAQTHGQTHLGHVITNPGTGYTDSAGHAWPASGGRVSYITIAGVPYYFPSQII
jgi:hypothetical protein